MPSSWQLQCSKKVLETNRHLCHHPSEDAARAQNKSQECQTHHLQSHVPPGDHSEPSLEHPRCFGLMGCSRLGSVCGDRGQKYANVRCCCCCCQPKKASNDAACCASFHPPKAREGEAPHCCSPTGLIGIHIEGVGCGCCSSRATLGGVHAKGDSIKSAVLSDAFALFFSCLWVVSSISLATPPPH